jgi:hypothetical protein
MGPWTGQNLALTFWYALIMSNYLQIKLYRFLTRLVDLMGAV